MEEKVISKLQSTLTYLSRLEPGASKRHLLPPHLNNLPVRIGVQLTGKRGAASRAILSTETTRLVPNPTSITERLGA